MNYLLSATLSAAGLCIIASLILALAGCARHHSVGVNKMIERPVEPRYIHTQTN